MLPAPLRDWVQQVLGDHEAVRSGERSPRRRGGRQPVTEVVDGTGSRWFVKQVARERTFRAEVTAYRRWVPALHPSVPVLRAHHPELRALVVTALPGRAPDATDAEAQRQAGALLRRVHDSRPVRAQHPRHRGRTLRWLDEVVRRNTGLFPDEDIAFARDGARRLAAMPVAPTVQCHGDFYCHNWLVDDAARLRLIDFGDARRDRAAYDFVQLALKAWWHRPDLASAFLDGYGGPPDPDDVEFLRHRLATNALAQVALGRRIEVDEHVRLGRSRLADLRDGYHPLAELTVTSVASPCGDPS